MPILFFHFHDGVDRLHDPDGAELTLAQARARALREARALIAHDVLEGIIDLGQRIEVEEADGTLFQTLSFRDAVEIRGLNQGPDF
ncbi:MAG: hypothetical protein ABI810_13690 [Sphingomonas bacterium]